MLWTGTGFLINEFSQRVQSSSGLDTRISLASIKVLLRLILGQLSSPAWLVQRCKLDLSLLLPPSRQLRQV